MNTIYKDEPGVLILNIFTMRPENQEALVACMREGAPTDAPGLKSVKLLKSRDGSRVINYMRWDSREAFHQSMTGNSTIAATRQRVHALIESAALDEYDIIEVK